MNYSVFLRLGKYAILTYFITGMIVRNHVTVMACSKEWRESGVHGKMW